MSKPYRQYLFIYLGILLLCLLVFSPVFQAGYVNWDDNFQIYENPIVLNPDWGQPVSLLKDIFTQRHGGIYTPLPTLTYVLESGIYGVDQPGWWHLDNVLLHSLVTFLVFLISRGLGLRLFPALLVTLLFAIHPMRTESVAWLTARKDLLYGLFFFGGIYYYLKYREADRKRSVYLAGVWICFLLALFSKVLAVAFPVVLVLIDVLKDQRLDGRRLIAKTPFFLISIAFGLISIYLANSYESIEVQTTDFSLFDRLALASSAFVMYLAKLVFPYQMVPLYPYPREISLDMYLSIVGGLLFVGLWVWSFWKRKYWLFFSLGFFLVNIALTVQFIPVGQGYKADRYTYVAYFGLFVLLAMGISTLLNQRKGQPRWWWLAMILLLAFYAPFTYIQSRIWENSKTLWAHQLKYMPNNATAYKNTADYYRQQNDPQSEYRYLARGIQIKPDDSGMTYRMGMLISEQPQFGTTEQVLQWLSRTIDLDSTYAGVYVNRAVFLAQAGQREAALLDLQQAEVLNPNNSEIYLNRSVILNGQGNLSEALISLDQYLALEPQDADKWVIKAQMLQKLQRYEEALQAIDQALKLENSKGIYHFTRALILNTLGRTAEAKQEVERSRQKGYTGQEEQASTILQQ